MICLARPVRRIRGTVAGLAAGTAFAGIAFAGIAFARISCYRYMRGPWNLVGLGSRGCSPMQSFESISQLFLPPQVECRLQELTRRQSAGTLTSAERQELALLMEAQNSLAALRAKATSLRGSGSPAPAGTARTVRNGLPVVLVPTGTPVIDPTLVRRCLRRKAFDRAARRERPAESGVGEPSGLEAALLCQLFGTLHG